MKNKFFILIFGVLAIVIVMMNLPATKTQPSPISVVTTTQQAVNSQPVVVSSTPSSTVVVPSPSGPQIKCTISQEKISTSTWKTFTNPTWEITFQYPPTWEIDESRSDLISISGDGNQLDVRMDGSEHGLVPTGAEEPSYCPRTVLGQRVDVSEFYFSFTHATSTRVLGVQQTHSYGIYFNSPSSTADTMSAIFYTILDTM